jgi:hypothetical protein
MAVNKYERETVEFQPITITRDGVVITTNIETCITALDVRPVTWISAIALGDKVGCMIEDLTEGTYEVWVRVTDSPEIPVKSAGTFQVL